MILHRRVSPYCSLDKQGLYLVLLSLNCDVSLKQSLRIHAVWESINFPLFSIKPCPQRRLEVSWYDDNNNMLLCLSDEIPIIKSVYRQQYELPFE